jgi:Ca-activated chloride channel family protein
VKVPGSHRAPVNLALVIDRSGSMAGEKLLQAKRAAGRLVELLEPGDRLAIVHYGNDVRVLPGLEATPENKVRMQRYVDGISEGGGTNIGDGLEAGRAQLAAGDDRVKRILFLSDGQPTVGLTSPHALEALVARYKSQGVSLTALGVGADFNEDLMTRLAARGGGAYGFISRSADTTALFEKDLSQAATMVARGVTLRLAVPDDVDVLDIYGREVTRSGRDVVVGLPDISAGQVERLVVHYRARVTRSEGAIDISRFGLEYRDLVHERPAQTTLALSAMATTDGAQALARRDAQAVVLATRAQAAENTRAAAVAVEKGHAEEAKRALEANDLLFTETEQLAGPAAMKEDRAQNQGAFGLTSVGTLGTAEGRSAATKSLKVQSLRQAGWGDSLY